ncbi:MAG: hypothetical protein EA402_10355 [Planctomycetota bacterium]|nr:MAG: hypothetical protein EA402_10355 [Planctomycetota bacterium]
MGAPINSPNTADLLPKSFIFNAKLGPCLQWREAKASQRRKPVYAVAVFFYRTEFASPREALAFRHWLCLPRGEFMEVPLFLFLAKVF